MTRAAVIDTNVVAAGLMTGHDDAPTARILDGMLTAVFPFAVSIALLAEYRDVLNRPALCKRHRLKSAEVELLLVALAQNAIVLTARAGPAAPTRATSTCGVCWRVTTGCASSPAIDCCCNSAPHLRAWFHLQSSSRTR